MKKSFIIKKAEEFSEIINNGKLVKGKNVFLYYFPSNDIKFYFGIAVGKKIGNAVKRNKQKRIIRMIVHENQNLFKKGFKYIIMIRRECLTSKYAEISEEVKNILGKVN